MKNSIITKYGRECANPECGCNGIKPWSEFSLQKENNNGHTSKCKRCMQDEQNARRNKKVTVDIELESDCRALDSIMINNALTKGLLA